MSRLTWANVLVPPARLELAPHGLGSDTYPHPQAPTSTGSLCFRLRWLTDPGREHHFAPRLILGDCYQAAERRGLAGGCVTGVRVRRLVRAGRRRHNRHDSQLTRDGRQFVATSEPRIPTESSRSHCLDGGRGQCPR
jgi:hypothetical protein